MIKNADNFYETRNHVINILEGIEPKIEESNFDWLHRPKEELEDLIKRIEDDKDLDNDEQTNIMTKKLLSFLNDIMTKKIKNKKRCKKELFRKYF